MTKILGLKIHSGKADTANSNAISHGAIGLALIETDKGRVKVNLKSTSLKLIRKYELGVSLKELAIILNINERTLRRYESGDDINPNVAGELIELCSTVQSMIDSAKNMIANKKPNALALLSYSSQADFEQYKPDSALILKSVVVHKRMVASICAFAKSKKIDCEIIEFDPGDYFAWIKSTKNDDNEMNRAEWATNSFARN